MADDEDLEQDVRERRRDVHVPRLALIVALVVALASLGCRRSSNVIAPDPSDRPKKHATPNDDEVDVWSIVVDDMIAPYAGTIGSMSVARKSYPPGCRISAKDVPTAKKETVDAVDAMKFDAPVRALHTRNPTSLVDFDPGALPPTGIVFLSPVAFDAAHGDALVFVAVMRTMTDQRAVTYHLVRDGASWRKMEIVRCA